MASKRVAGYASNLNNLLRQFSEKKLYGSDAETIKQLITDLRGIMTDMVSLNETAIEQKFTKVLDVDPEDLIVKEGI
jgi:hypothetical protein